MSSPRLSARNAALHSTPMRNKMKRRILDSSIASTSDTEKKRQKALTESFRIVKTPYNQQKGKGFIYKWEKI